PGGTPIEKLLKHSTDEPTPIEELRPDVPPEVAALLRKLLAKDPKDRYQTPAEVVEALAPFAVSGPTPWAPRRAAPFLDPAGPPAKGLDSDPDMAGEGAEPDADEALARTVSAGQSPTPRSGPLSAIHISHGLRQDQGRRLWKVLLCTLAVAGVIGLAAVA